MRHSVLLEAYLEHELDLLRFLGKRLGSAGLAADLAHDLYLKLCRIEPPATVRDGRAYLFTMAANLATDHLRVEKRRGEIRVAADGTVWRQTDELTPERHAMARAELAYLETVIAALPARCREVFYLNRYEGRSQAEIADSLGIGVTTVYKDLKTAMAALVAARRRFRGHLPDSGQDGQSQENAGNATDEHGIG
ncbi:RNA polymerase sigma factor [Pelagibius sp.]|uniref:RNA polymerase sigma factor n=1 Tax=Pelagibius sp. TaxID=1931238 RepID=UPI003BAF62C9